MPRTAQLPLHLSPQPIPRKAFSALPHPAHHFLAGTLLLVRCQGLELDTSPPATDAATAPLPEGVDMVRATVLRSFSSVSACLQTATASQQQSMQMFNVLYCKLGVVVTAVSTCFLYPQTNHRSSGGLWSVGILQAQDAHPKAPCAQQPTFSAQHTHLALTASSAASAFACCVWSLAISAKYSFFSRSSRSRVRAAMSACM